MKLVALLKQEKGSRVIEHKNQQKNISFVDNRISAMQRRSNILSVIQRRLAYSKKYCDNIIGAEQKFNELDGNLYLALSLAKLNFCDQYGKNTPGKHWFIRKVEESRFKRVVDNFIYAAWGQYVEYFLNAIVARNNSWIMQKVLGHHRPDYYQSISGGELYADLTSVSEGGGKHVTSKLTGSTFARPVCAVDIMYDDNAMLDCITSPSIHYKPFYIQTSTKETLINIKNTLIKFSLNLYELNLEEIEQNGAFGVLPNNELGLSLKEICNRSECGIYQTPIEMVSDIKRVFSSWNILIKKEPSPLSQAMILVMNHVMEVINNHIEKILNAPTWQQAMQTTQNKLMSIERYPKNRTL